MPLNQNVSTCPISEYYAMFFDQVIRPIPWTKMLDHDPMVVVVVVDVVVVVVVMVVVVVVMVVVVGMGVGGYILTPYPVRVSRSIILLPLPVLEMCRLL